nr:sigma factor-like helix-turn-helix DNA-binding protein [Bifidobacterium pongonis]
MLLFSLDEREHAIVIQRIMSDHPSTLDELGKEFGITRERVRQVEKTLRDTLSSLLDGEFHMSERLGAMFEAEGPILRYSTAVRLVPELDITLEPEGLPVLPLIAAVCSPEFSVSDGWLASPSIDDAVKLVKTDLPQAADKYGVVDLTPSASHASSEQRERENRNFADWLSYSGIIMYKDHAIIGRAQNDRAVAVLSIEGHPLTTDEIAERIGAGNARSMRNRLADDERIMRVDVSSWGLRDWNLEEYSGIRQEIRERIERNGGSVKLDDLMDELCSQFSISSKSVMTYAASLPFASSNGVVTLAGAERFDVPDADPYGTPRLFRIDGGWALRTTVNAEHARGSGSILPLAVAHILGMRFGDSAELASPLGTQSVYWTGTNVNLGTIRRFIQAGVIGVGDEAFLKFMDDGSFALEPARSLNGDALHDALALACCPETSDDRRAFDALRETLGNRDCSSFATLTELFAQRGDGDIADLLRRLP